MKKRIILIVIASFMFMGIVSGASLWGTYKGYSKVKMVIDSKEYTGSSVPAVLVNGQTMIPISALKQLGVTYSYDSKKLTASFTTNKLGSRPDDVTNIKLYSDGASSFQKLRTLSDSFGFVNRDFLLTRFYLPQNPDVNLNASLEALNGLINEYNDLISPTNSQSQKLRNAGMYTAADQLDNALSKYSSAIDFYRSAYESLEKYNSDPDYIDKYLDNDSNALKLVGEAVSISNSGFTAFQNMIKDYVVTTSSAPPSYVPPILDTTTINSRIDGSFDGFEYDKVFLLQNGQIWKQTSFDIKISIKYSPKVTIFKDGSSYYMLVDGVDKKVKVQKIK